MSYGRGGPPRYSADRPDPRSGLPTQPAPAPVNRPPPPTQAEVLRDLSLLGAATRDGRYGSAGKKIEVKVNCFPADISKLVRIVTHFDIAYEKVVPEDVGRGGRGGRGRGGRGGRGARGGRGGRGGARGQPLDERPLALGIATKLIRDIERNYASDFNSVKIAHDGRKNAYTAFRPPWDQKEFDAEWEGVKYKVIFKVANDVNMEELTDYISGRITSIPQECITVLDIVLRTSPLREWVYTGKSFGVPPVGDQLQSSHLGDGCEAWVCYYQAFRPNENGMFLTFDVMYSAFYAEQSLYDYTVELLAPPQAAPQEEGGQSAFQQPLTPNQIFRLTMELQGVRVRKSYGTEEEKKKFNIKSISKQPASQIEYEQGDGSSRRMSVQEYFANIGEALVHPHMPCVQVPQGKNASVYIPLEKLMIDSGQQRKKPLTAQMKERLSKIAVQAPLSRMGRIGDVLGDVNQATQQYLGAFGVKVDLDKLSIPARVVDAPRIQLGKGMSLEVGENPNHEFSYTMNNNHFYQPGKPLKSWGVLVLADVVKYDVQKFVAGTRFVLNQMGLDSEIPSYSFSYTPLLQKAMIDLFTSINDDPNKPPCQLIMVVKHDEATRDYNRIKNVSDTYLGIPTQCVVAKHVLKPTKLYVQNLALKINAKLGGVTARIPGDHFEPMGKRFMIVGATVTHASGHEVVGDTPSVCSMVGSLDKRCGRYVGCWRFQAAATAGLPEFGDMFAELLRNFHARENFLPDNVLIYRNGVADVQFANVLKTELNDARSKAKEVGREIGEEYKPKITFVVMQRGHHTRFIPSEDSPKDKSENCIPGTVIDSKVTHPRHFDFFLISHNGIQGVSRPQRYTVLMDDMNFTPDQIQGLTYHLCYTFTRCTKSVSIVPAVYYADLLAVRVRAYQAARAPPRMDLVAGLPPLPSPKDTALPQSHAEGDPLMHKNLNCRFFYV